jgi:LEA14-like dessication related protein
VSPILESSIGGATVIRRSLLSLPWFCLAALTGCAVLPGREPPRINVVGIEALRGEGIELRFALKLRVQNPNEVALDYNGVSLDLEVNGRPLASGVANVSGSIERFGEAVITVPVTVSLTAALRQMLGWADGPPRGELPYRLRGRFAGGYAGGFLGGSAFASEGTLKLPQ